MPQLHQELESLSFGLVTSLDLNTLGTYDQCSNLHKPQCQVPIKWLSSQNF